VNGRLAAAVSPLLLLLACHGTPAPLSAAPARGPSVFNGAADTIGGAAVESLRKRISELIESPAVAAGTWGVDVRSLKTGDVLFELNAHRLLTPASVMKTITLAIAADQLGWNYTYDTWLEARGPIASGVLNGDLVIVGSGDPSLDDWDGVASGVFASWAARLRDLGVTTVRGHVIGDDRAFGGPPLGSGWAWDDLLLSYSTPASGLQFNEGTAQIIMRPEGAGAPATITIAPRYAPLVLRGVVNTGARGSALSTIVTPGAGAEPASDHASQVVSVTGSIPADSERIIVNVAIHRPAKYFAEAVRAALRANGVTVNGAALEIGEVDPAPGPGKDAAVATHRSPPLSSLADTMMKLSQNLFAESLLRTLGRERGSGGTLDAGRSVEQDVLTSWGIASPEVVITDGSGLSRYNLVTANAVAAVLTHVYRDDRLRDPYVASLPVAGRAGTLRGRMNGTAAEGAVHAKTGSFSNARSVAGFVQASDGEPLAFAIIANNYGEAATAVDHVIDGLLVSLAEFRR
jgi:D-alanyl-D-alanine carboxypeptidase/D-alanyl-D-alanine-endopeptidase (penicillin-binding protein 4)